MSAAVLYRNAVREVARDVRESWPELTDNQAVAHVRDTMRLPESPYVAGAYPLDDDGTWTATAYRIVLSVPGPIFGPDRPRTAIAAVRELFNAMADHDAAPMNTDWSKPRHLEIRLAVAYGDRIQYSEYGDSMRDA